MNAAVRSFGGVRTSLTTEDISIATGLSMSETAMQMHQAWQAGAVRRYLGRRRRRGLGPLWRLA